MFQYVHSGPVIFRCGDEPLGFWVQCPVGWFSNSLSDLLKTSVTLLNFCKLFDESPMICLEVVRFCCTMLKLPLDHTGYKNSVVAVEGVNTVVVL